MNILIYKYNNYYNRKLKKEAELADYGSPIHTVEDVGSFTPGDGVNTFFNYCGAPYDNSYQGEGDYLIVEQDGSICSRWFILDISYTRDGQWNLNLRRDLLVDFYDAYINSDCFIEKATLQADDPLVFNDENMTFNQIKKEETLLKDNSGCAWVVGYVDKDFALDNVSIPKNTLSNLNYKTIDYNILNWPFLGSVKGALRGNYIINTTSSFNQSSLLTDAFNINLTSGVVNTTYNTNAQSYSLVCIKGYDETREALSEEVNNGGLNTLNSYLPGYFTNNLSQAEFEEFLTFSSGDLVRDNQGKFYNIYIKSLGNKSESKSVTLNDGLFIELKNIVNNTGCFTGSPNANTFDINVNYQEFEVGIVERTDLNITFSIPANRLFTEDAPYDIFAIPYGNIKVTNSTGTITTDKGVSLATAATIIEKATNLKLYDIQLVPYCPVLNLIRSDQELYISNEEQATPITDNETGVILSYIFYVPNSQFSVNLPYSIEVKETAIDKKVSNQCDKYRLCSPNFNGYFDFSPAKNEGVQYFSADCCYKPYQPYIHINPNFNGLYGEDFNDARGLICGGDFSLTQINDAWEQYQIQNKNYQETFNRQIENMEIQNKYQRRSEILNAVVGTGTGAGAGAVIGNMLLPGLGGLIGGAVVGGAASGGGGIGDLVINEKLRAEALDYTKDLFNYQLGNIQALPATLTKVSSLNNNNKIFPLIEHYTCTDREKDAFKKKVAYNGMTVMVIDKPSSYISNSWETTTSDGTTITDKGYIKGSIIRMEDLEDDFHLLKSISDEFYKGVYIK